MKSAPSGASAGAPGHATAGATWSRYNRLFCTARYGGFLHNALSNRLFKLDDAHYGAAERLRAAAGAGGGAAGAAEAARSVDALLAADPLLAAEPDFAAALRAARVLVEPGEENKALLTRQYRRHAANFSTATLGLTICPTLACDFACPYCFEHSQRDGATMTPETMDRLVAFVAAHEEIDRLFVTWYGGEPTLAWDVVRELTGRFLELPAAYEKAGLVTNGYLLDAGKIAEFDDLRIGSVQITLDGPREVHDTRRVLLGGGPTFDRILANVDALVESGFQGRCTIRVNVDRDSLARYAELRAALLERYAGAKLSVYAGHVNADPGHPYDTGCALDVRDWAGLMLALYAEAGLTPARGFYPKAGPGGCVATAYNGFVVGPVGELYKCWEDVGVPEMVVGNVHAEVPVTDPVLCACYAIGTDPHDDSACRDCDVLPICDGGCPRRRLHALQLGEEGYEFCVPERSHLEEYLEAYYDALLTREICAAVLSPGRPEHDERGWRDVTRERRREPADDPLAGPIPAAGEE